MFLIKNYFSVSENKMNSKEREKKHKQKTKKQWLQQFTWPTRNTLFSNAFLQTLNPHVHLRVNCSQETSLKLLCGSPSSLLPSAHLQKGLKADNTCACCLASHSDRDSITVFNGLNSAQGVYGQTLQRLN